MPRSVIYVPGLPATHLADTRTGRRIFLNLLAFNSPELEGPDDLRADEPIRAEQPVRRGASLLFFDIAKQAQSLYDLLDRLGIPFVPVGWDWRRPVYDDVFRDPAGPFSIQPRLTAAIRNTRRSSGQKVVVIAHSTGGLVLRSLLEKDPSLVEHIEFVIAFGVPWAGTPRSMESINGQQGFATVSAERAQEILVSSWAGWDLSPPDPTHLHDEQGNPLMMTFRRTPAGRQQASILTDTDWIHSLPLAIQARARQRAAAAGTHLGPRRPTFDLGGRRLRVINIVGWGYPTRVEAELFGSGTGATLNVLPAITQDATLDGGDGTVPRRSAAWIRNGTDLDVTTHHVPIGWLPSTRTRVHGRLWSNPGGINLLGHHLAGEDLQPFCYAALDRNDVSQGSTSASIRVRLVALAGDGSPLDGAQVRTRHLSGGQLSESFDARFSGRHLMEIPRARIRRVGNPNVRLRRLALEIGWQEGGRTLWQSRQFTFFG